jgi:hypothetical protein
MLARRFVEQRVMLVELHDFLFRLQIHRASECETPLVLISTEHAVKWKSSFTSVERNTSLQSLIV